MKTYAKIFDNELLLRETRYKEHFFKFLHEFSKTHQRSAEPDELELMMAVFESFTKESSSADDKKTAAKSFLTNSSSKAVAIKNPLLMRKLFCDQEIILMNSDKEFALNFLESSLSNPSAFISFFKFDATLINELTQNLRKAKQNLCQSILANRFLYASNDTLDKFLKGDKRIHEIILVLNMDPIDERKLDHLAEILKQSDSIKLSEDTRINKTILHDKDRIKKFLKGEKIPLTNLQSVTQFLTSHGDYKALIAVCDLSSLNLTSISDPIIRQWNNSPNTPAICINKKINRLIKENLDSVKRFIRLDESLIRLIRLADELVDTREITDAHKEQARAIISLRDRIALNRNPTENDAIYASAESLTAFLKTE